MFTSGTPLGDPIELGAAAAVLCSGNAGSKQHTRPRSMSLQSSKSWMGHAEPASGVVGLLYAATSLRLAVDLPVMHLGRMSGHALGAMGATESSRAGGDGGGGVSEAIRAPKQPAARPRPRHDRPTAQGEVAGISAFAFQVRGGSVRERLS